MKASVEIGDRFGLNKVRWILQVRLRGSFKRNGEGTIDPSIPVPSEHTERLVS